MVGLQVVNQVFFPERAMGDLNAKCHEVHTGLNRILFDDELLKDTSLNDGCRSRPSLVDECCVVRGEGERRDAVIDKTDDENVNKHWKREDKYGRKQDCNPGGRNTDERQLRTAKDKPRQRPHWRSYRDCVRDSEAR